MPWHLEDVAAIYPNKARTLPAAKLSDAADEALGAAIIVYRKRTGLDITRTDISRKGAREFIESMGLAWPEETQ